jgi:hypothetical protein
MERQLICSLALGADQTRLLGYTDMRHARSHASALCPIPPLPIGRESEKLSKASAV